MQFDVETFDDVWINCVEATTPREAFRIGRARHISPETARFSLHARVYDTASHQCEWFTAKPFMRPSEDVIIHGLAYASSPTTA
jgi:hypothetical protein